MFKKFVCSSLMRNRMAFNIPSLFKMYSASATSSKVAFRIYGNNKDTSLYYFNLSTPIKDI